MDDLRNSPGFEVATLGEHQHAGRPIFLLGDYNSTCLEDADYGFPINRALNITGIYHPYLNLSGRSSS